MCFFFGRGDRAGTHSARKFFYDEVRFWLSTFLIVCSYDLGKKKYKTLLENVEQQQFMSDEINGRETHSNVDEKFKSTKKKPK